MSRTTGPSPAVPLAATAGRAALRGLSASVPLILGILPFGMVTGALAVEVGMTPLQALGMSILVFAGAGQVTALGLYGSGAPVWLAAAGAIVVNLRLLMYSAGIAPIFRPLSPGRKLLFAYLLTDQSFILAVDHYQHRRSPLLRGTYYLALSAALWSAWQVGTVLGALAGRSLSAGGWLDFMIPLTFISLLMPALRGRPAVAAAIASALVVLPARGLPLNLGLMAATAAGIGAGLAVGRWTRR